MNIHQVILNGKQVAVGVDHNKMSTMARSVQHRNEHGEWVATHELVTEGVDSLGTDVTEIRAPLSLQNGDVIKIVIGQRENNEQGA